MTLFYAVHHWNGFFNALIYLNSKAKSPVQIMLRNIVVASEFADQQADIGSVATNFNVVAQNYKYAVIMITVLPIICVYPFLQKHSRRSHDRRHQGMRLGYKKETVWIRESFGPRGWRPRFASQAVAAAGAGDHREHGQGTVVT
jgi:hypothetical protein